MTQFQIWQKNYRPPNPEIWKGRHDGEQAKRFHEMVGCLSLLATVPQENSDFSVALIGFACDEGIKRNSGRSGAKEGPDAFRRALANLPWHSSESIRLIDVGNIFCDDDNLEASQDALATVIALLHQNNIRTFVIGGGHELSWAHFKGLPSQQFALVNFDAHFDLRPLHEKKGTSGTSFLQIARHCQTKGEEFRYICIGIQSVSTTPALFQAAKELDVRFLLADELHQDRLEDAFDLIDDVITKNDALYISLCLDVFASPFAPGVSAPQPLGIIPSQAIPLLQRLASSGKVAGFDIAELSPPHDPMGETALLAAQLFSLFFTKWIE